MKRYRLRLTPLTPIHIGTGEEYGPLEYCVIPHPSDQRHSLYLRFDLDAIVARMARTDSAAALRLGETTNLTSVIEQVHQLLTDEEVRYSSATTHGFANKYRAKLGDPMNQLLVGAMVRDPRGRPIIPGSSLKGAIRTAMVSEWTRGQAIRNPHTTEAELLDYRNPASDPFRALRPADAVFTCKAADFVGEVMNYSRAKGESNQIQMIREQISGREWGGPSTETTMEVDDALLERASLSPKIDADGLAAACRDFYLRRAQEEHKRFYATPTQVTARADKCYRELISQAQQYPPDTFLVRLGRYSGFESVTIDAARAPGAHPPRHGASRALSDGALPLGWLEVQVLPS